MADDSAMYDAAKARMEAHNAYYALSRDERAVVDAQRQEEAEKLSGLIYEEGGEWYRVTDPNKPMWHAPGWMPF
ncbi:hypothetical protein D3C80_2034950 [compost metagenome]